MHVLLDLRYFKKDIPSKGSFFCIDFLHALFRNHPDYIFFLWTTGKEELPTIYRFEEYSNVKRIHTEITSNKLHFLINFFGYPYIDDIVETLAMKNGHMPWVSKFDVSFFFTPYPILLEENCYHVQFTSNLNPIYYSEIYTRKSKSYHSLKHYKKSIMMADLNIFPSKYLKNDIMKKFSKLEEEKCMVFPLGLIQDFQEIHESELVNNNFLKNLNLSENFIFVKAGNDSLKNIVKAFELFKIKFHDKKWNMIIEEPYDNSLNFEYFDSSIKIIPPLLSDNRKIILSKAYLTLLSSLYDTEGKVFLQSIRCGTPVISSGYGAFSEYTIDHNMIFDTNSYYDILKCLTLLVNNQTLYEEVKKKGKEKSAEKQFCWDDNAILLMQHISEELEKRETE
jgi:glycosyltransferase involved in cell wall biosynthesis